MRAGGSRALAAIGWPWLLLLAPASHAAGPSFALDILPTLKARCTMCHSTGGEAGHLGLAPTQAFQNLSAGVSQEAGLKLIEPYDPDRSYLVMKLQGTHLDHGGHGARMPLGDSPLDPSFVEMLRQWILAGARDD